MNKRTPNISPSSSFDSVAYLPASLWGLENLRNLVIENSRRRDSPITRHVLPSLQTCSLCPLITKGKSRILYFRSHHSFHLLCSKLIGSLFSRGQLSNLFILLQWLGILFPTLLWYSGFQTLPGHCGFEAPHVCFSICIDFWKINNLLFATFKALLRAHPGTIDITAMPFLNPQCC